MCSYSQELVAVVFIILTPGFHATTLSWATTTTAQKSSTPVPPNPTHVNDVQGKRRLWFRLLATKNWKWLILNCARKLRERGSAFNTFRNFQLEIEKKSSNFDLINKDRLTAEDLLPDLILAVSDFSAPSGRSTCWGCGGGLRLMISSCLRRSSSSWRRFSSFSSNWNPGQSKKRSKLSLKLDTVEARYLGLFNSKRSLD